MELLGLALASRVAVTRSTGWRTVGAAVFCSLVTLALPVAAESYDRKPVTMSGLYPDGWGQSLGGYQEFARDRYADHRVFCAGIFMRGYRSDSSWIHGTTRYWDKAFCVAVQDINVRRGKSFVLDAKRTRITTYRVRTF